TKTKSAALPHGYKLDKGYIYKMDDQGGDKRICSDIQVLALTRDPQSSNWGRLVELIDFDKKPHRFPISNATLSADSGELIKEFASEGATIDNPNLFKRYLNDCIPTARVTCVGKTGWHGSAFVLPDKTIG